MANATFVAALNSDEAKNNWKNTFYRPPDKQVWLVSLWGVQQFWVGCVHRICLFNVSRWAALETTSRACLHPAPKVEILASVTEWMADFLLAVYPEGASERSEHRP